MAGFDFGGYDVVVNAAAYTKVDAAETTEGRRDAWRSNVSGVAALVEAARTHRFALVHVSSDYVFDGTMPSHLEDEPFSPLGVYGQTKAAGDALVATLPRHYILRTSWVIGDGPNFVATMASLADRGIAPSVVDDQYGRLTFTDEITRAVSHLLEVDGGGRDLQRLQLRTGNDAGRRSPETVYAGRGRPESTVTPVSTQSYGAGKTLAPRPRHSALDLAKISATGFEPRPARDRLASYLAALPPPPR